MKLLDSIIEFEKVFGRSGHDIGSMQINITSSESCNLETLYDILNFSKPLTIGGELFMHIYPKDMLDKMQQGWYWVLSKENTWVQDGQNWNKNWIVFATRNDAAIYFNQTDNCVYGAIEKSVF